MDLNIMYLIIGSGVLAVLYGIITSISVLSADTGNEKMQEIAKAIQEGAGAYLSRQYRTIAIVGIVILLISYRLLGLEVAIGFLIGSVMSGIAGYIGMLVSVRANVRTTQASSISLASGLSIAFKSGAVTGMLVAGLALLAVSVYYYILTNVWTPEDGRVVIDSLVALGFGSSLISIFARLGGGIFTKGADVGGDLVGKVEAGIPEDDPRNPATIADNVGDNVGDVAGMGADLFESYAGSLIATISLAIFIGVPKLNISPGDDKLIMLPLIISGIGIIASLIGTFLVRTKANASMNSLLWSFRIGIFSAAILTLIGGAVAGSGSFLNVPFELIYILITGLVVGQVIGTATEYFTSYEYFPVKWISKQSLTGHPSNIIAGISVGLYSTAIPAICVVIGVLISHHFAGLYGVGLAAVGMLSTLGITLSTDAYGPVADNAGGLAEQAGLDPEVRERTDALDALGNTTAATGKGFAIGSAILTALALMSAYGQVTGVTSFDIGKVDVLSGVLIGALLPFVFSGLTMQAVGSAAGAMIEEVRRQFREIKGLREGKKGVKPDAARAVEISTTGSLKAMILPSILAIISPILIGLFLKAEALGGMLAGSIVSGFLLAIFMANSGGAWDNAKKYIELGNHGGKGSDAHKAAVTGDTVGDPFKDTSGPSINILLKLMTIVALVFGPLFIG